MSQYNKLSNIQYARFQILPVDLHFGLFWSAGIPTMYHTALQILGPIQYANLLSVKPGVTILLSAAACESPLTSWCILPTSYQLPRQVSNHQQLCVISGIPVLFEPNSDSFLKFLKWTLGVRRQIPTAAIMGDLGRCLPYVRLQVKAVKFWCKLISKPSGRLPNIAYKKLLSLKEFGFTTWLDKISQILDKCELFYIFNSNSFTTSEINNLTSQIEIKLQDSFTEKWHTEIIQLPKLRIYKLFKSSFETEEYLFILNKNHRQALSRFRLSAHTLEIEKGCWYRKLADGKWRSAKIPIEERLCTYCSNNDVETEYHILITCTKYSDLRSDLFNVAKDLIINFDELDSECKFITILESDETSLVQQLTKCIHHILKRRIEHVNARHVKVLL